MFETISSASVMLGQSFSLLAQAAAGESTEVAWYQSGYVMFITLILILFGSWAAGRAIAKSLRMDDYSTKLGIIIGCMLISILVVSTKWPPKFGIDLRGGMNLIGELNLDDLDSGQSDYGVTTQTTAKDIIPILVRRVDPSGTREIMIRSECGGFVEAVVPAGIAVMQQRSTRKSAGLRLASSFHASSLVRRSGFLRQWAPIRTQ